jgi:hypothetical protein
VHANRLVGAEPKADCAAELAKVAPREQEREVKTKI